MAHLKNWLRDSALAHALFGPALPEDPTRHPYATATTPDELIAATIIQSFARDFDDWRVSGDLREEVSGIGAYIPAGTLINEKMGVRVAVSYTRRTRERYAVSWTYKPSSVSVDGTKLDDAASKKVLAAWSQVSASVKAAQDAAAEAKRTMEENEQKWNLAEKLLGMKRTPEGALVPAVPVQ